MSSLGKNIAGQRELIRQSTGSRQWKNAIFLSLCLGAATLSLVMLVVLLGTIALQGYSAINWNFFVSANSADADRAGIFPAMMGSLWVCVGCALTTLPIGVGTAIYLEEFRAKHPALRWFRKFVQLNITNLAGVPSVVYGILGLTAFVGMFGLFGSEEEPSLELGVSHYLKYQTDNERRFVRIPVRGRSVESVELKSGMTAYNGRDEAIELRVRDPESPVEEDAKLAAITVAADAEASPAPKYSWYYVRFPFGVSVLAGSLTLMLVVLPVVIISTQEALRAVPDSLREGALGLGATRWQTVWNITLPSAIPGVMTGAILAMSRAIGEAAPVLIISGIVFIKDPPGHLMDDFTVMPLQIFNWVAKPTGQGFGSLAAGAILVLLAMLLLFNGLAVFIRHRLQKPLS